MAAKTVEALLDDVRLLSEEAYVLVQAVRSLTHETLGSISEEVKYGGILFMSAGLWFGGVFAYQQHVSVEFSKGALIVDPFGQLEGTGKGRRHVKLRCLDDVSSKHLAVYLKLAFQATGGQA
ncbi:MULTISPECIES: DUF1801 domain-containing protein [unclassified Cyanobium]|uniref:DUF1801 domain-containing protein n=1 Tax=unclassified Cyanobium TaxID=2627006 RepID=UPI0020CF390C|nr:MULTISPECIES: DUF1801 domain-containing protein [unclassified Cyanobium]MCP9860588.1 DUF1801 domain-containing protein [Cyanobium sp. Cruz-8H5]MCP9867825.1 DUF1801 domain-containing protein [Cyanobium sp. Cruz-8D1]